jgi:hypothetical protein
MFGQQQRPPGDFLEFSRNNFGYRSLGTPIGRCSLKIIIINNQKTLLVSLSPATMQENSAMAAPGGKLCAIFFKIVGPMAE